MKQLIANSIKTFDSYTFGIIIITVVLIIIACYANKLYNDKYGHRWTDITEPKPITKESRKKMSLRQSEKLKDQKYAMNYVANHPDKFFRDHYPQFHRCFMDAVEYKRNKQSKTS
jgi:hypothetical protein